MSTALRLTELCHAYDKDSSVADRRRKIWGTYQWFENQLVGRAPTDEPKGEPKWERHGPYTWRLYPFTIREDHLSVKQKFEVNRSPKQVELKMHVIPNWATSAPPNAWQSVGWMIWASGFSKWKKRILHMEVNGAKGLFKIANEAEVEVFRIPTTEGVSTGFDVTVLASPNEEVRVKVEDDTVVTRDIPCMVSPHPQLCFGFGNDKEEETKSTGFTVEAEVTIVPNEE